MGNIASTAQGAAQTAYNYGTPMGQAGQAIKFLGSGGGPQGDVDMSGRPVAPQFQSLRDKSGLLGNPNLRENAGPDVNLNTQGLEEIRKRALSTGPSAWAQLAQQQNQNQMAGQRTAAAANNASSQAQARGALASHGGLMGGAAERLASQGAQNQMNTRQGISAGGANNALNVSMQDAQQQQQLLSQLPGMEVQATQPAFQNRQINIDAQKYNIGNALQDKYANDQANQLQYQQQMQAWASQKQAEAIKNAGGGKKGGGGGANPLSAVGNVIGGGGKKG